jgi:hypothetical protein
MANPLITGQHGIEARIKHRELQVYDGTAFICRAMSLALGDQFGLESRKACLGIW